ncbi:hypothetical protein AGMMS50276_09600 [Synergistales bacterium]|nr:hypothetical protein AGMMS50276_09600 [Synergistales bacterium]
MRREEEEFYRSALSRLSLDDMNRESLRGGGIPYEYSIRALCVFFRKVAIRLGFMDENGLPAGPILLGVSGGGDSMALMWFFHTFYSGHIIAAHLEHGIRGADSAEDALHVKKYADVWGVDTEIFHADVPSLLKKGESLEAGARRIRYDFFERAAKKHGAWGVALGHNMEDEAETVLFNLLRGGGVLGAGGIPERRGIFFRPLLSLKREFLRGILRCRGIEWRYDKTNADTNYTRNFIRNNLMPMIESNINARASEHLANFARDMRELGDEEKEKGDALLLELEVAGTDALTIDRRAMRNLDSKKLPLLIRAAGRKILAPVLSRRQCLKLSMLCAEGKPFTFQWGGDVTVSGTHNEVAFRRISP